MREINDQYDIANFERPRPEEKAAIYKALKSPPLHKRKNPDIEVTEKRRLAIAEVFDVKEESPSSIKAEYRGKKIEFFLLTDTWMSADKFGHGILELCTKLKGK